MTWRAALCCLVAVVAAISEPRAQSQSGRSDQDILTQLERDWDDAFHRRDVGFVETVLADEFIAIHSDGSRVSRVKELSLVAEFNQEVESTLDDFSVKVYGDTAVVRFTQQLVGPSQGRTLEVTLRYMDVWIMRAGRWQCVASQSTRVTASS